MIEEQTAREEDLRVEEIAKTAHEVNRVYCQGLGDCSQPPWEDAPEWQRESAYDGVRNLLENPAKTPEQSHQNWVRHKLERGWTYGPIKDPEKKEHPCLTLYEQLPSSQRAKDTLFRTTVLGLAEKF